MLTSTFQHLKGIGKRKERALWRSGIISWQRFELQENAQLSILLNSSLIAHNSILSNSKKAYEKEDADFFAAKLPQSEYYRISLSFPEKTIFLDIETTGLSRYYDSITIVGWSIGGEYQVYIAGDDDEKLREDLAQAKAIVTFNGSLFDLPFLKQEFKNISIPKTHIDLRFFARRIGFSGGQKSIEEQIGVKRLSNLVSLDGESAPILWHKYRHGDLEALKLLILYNHADIEGMKQIFDKVIQELVEREDLPIESCSVYCFSEKASSIEWLSNTNKKIPGSIKTHPYSGKIGPAIVFKDLSLTSQRGKLKVVGIDLTGSESRPSGWSILKGCEAITQQIYSDNSLIQATFDVYPDIVSIDSPLSLPKGRLTVYDDDPGRKKYGIVRECERILKKRGINVYPSLIKRIFGNSAATLIR